MILFYLRNEIFYRLSGNKFACLSSMIWPAIENSLSQSVDVGGGVRYLIAILRLEIRFGTGFHEQKSGPVKRNQIFKMAIQFRLNRTRVPVPVPVPAG